MRKRRNWIQRKVAFLAIGALLASAMVTATGTSASAEVSDAKAATETVSVGETATFGGNDCSINLGLGSTVHSVSVPCWFKSGFCGTPVLVCDSSSAKLKDPEGTRTTYTLSGGEEPITLATFADLCDADWAFACDIAAFFNCGYSVFPDCPKHPWQDSAQIDVQFTDTLTKTRS